MIGEKLIIMCVWMGMFNAQMSFNVLSLTGKQRSGGVEKN
jgi:hypothetical protein